VAQQEQRKLSKKVPQADPKDLQAHLDRVKKVEALAKVLLKAGRLSGTDFDAVTFHRLQAEEWLAEKKTFAEAVLSPGVSPRK
jgi:hypothetical protein